VDSMQLATATDVWWCHWMSTSPRLYRTLADSPTADNKKLCCHFVRIARKPTVSICHVIPRLSQQSTQSAYVLPSFYAALFIRP